MNLICFPNPVGDYLNIHCDCDVVKVRITSIIGQKMLEQTVSFNILGAQISTNFLQADIYFVSGINENGKIQVQKNLLKNNLVLEIYETVCR